MTMNVQSVLGGEEVISHALDNENDFYEVSENQLPKLALMALSNVMPLSIGATALLVGTSARSLYRLKEHDLLSSNISANVLFVAKVIAKAYELFEDKETVDGWLTTPNKALNGEEPIKMLKNRFGSEMVYDVLGRIAYGIPS